MFTSNSTSTTQPRTPPSAAATRQPLRPDEVAILDQMETEHAQITELERVDRALAEHDPKRLVDSVHTLAASLTAHMRHEENEALPLIDTIWAPRAGTRSP